MKMSIGIFALLLLTTSLFARDKQDFDKSLKAETSNVENYGKESFYEKFEFTDKNEKKKFSDFTEVDRSVFILIRCDSLSHQLEDLYNKWKEELNNAEEKPSSKKEASKKDITNYMDKLMELRKRNAEKVEILMNELFKKWQDKFTKEEQEYISKNIREYHDKNNLIKRK